MTAKLELDCSMLGGEVVPIHKSEDTWEQQQYLGLRSKVAVRASQSEASCCSMARSSQSGTFRSTGYVSPVPVN